MVDKDQAEINSIRKVFNESDVLLRCYHVTQAVTRWLSRYESDVSGLEKADSRAHIMQFMSELKSCSTVFLFHLFYNKYCKYFRNHWETIGHLWSNFGRCYKHGDSDTNKLIERYILFLCMFTALCICGLAGS
uniref:Uncharacterized protein n=1 Tax=Cyprinus carpio carpio TaxID=630221 RepID=A0A9J8AVI3_CYPCA